MDYGLSGRTVVLTGAARGQGAAEAGILVDGGHTSHGGTKPIVDALSRARGTS